MYDPQHETVMRENMKLEREKAELKELVEQLNAEKDQLINLNEDNKTLVLKISKEYDVSKNKLTQELVDKIERRKKYDADIERLHHEIERRQKEIESLQAQAIEPMDMDVFKLKIRKDYEAVHNSEMQEMQSLVDRLKEEINQSKREFEILNMKHENLKLDTQRDLDNAKVKYREELQVLMKENQNLQSKVEMSKDREMLRQARRELEEAKRRVEEYQKECNSLRKERDSLKDQMNDIVITHNKDIEEERSKKREAIAENDKLRYKIRV
jgi:chromosome segregation ATPase